MKKAFLVLAFLCLPGCAAWAPYELNYQEDKFEGSKTYSLEHNRAGISSDVGCNDGTPFGGFSFNPIKHTVGKNTQYAVLIVYGGSDWLFIENGKSLSLLVDGKKMVLSGEKLGAQDQVIAGTIYSPAATVIERAIYPIKKSQLNAISGATNVEIKVSGKRSNITGCLTGANLTNICQFLEDTK